MPECKRFWITKISVEISMGFLRAFYLEGIYNHYCINDLHKELIILIPHYHKMSSHPFRANYDYVIYIGYRIKHMDYIHGD